MRKDFKNITLPPWLNRHTQKNISDTSIPILIYTENEHSRLLSPIAHYEAINEHPRINIPFPESALDRCKLILSYQHAYFEDNIIAKLNLYHYLCDSDTAEQKAILEILGLPFSNHFNVLLKKILKLPAVFLDFCTAKKVGFKQLSYYAQFPKPIINFYADLLEKWPFSAQQLDKLLIFSLDLHHQQNIDFTTVHKIEWFKTLYTSDTGNKEKSKALLHKLSQLSSPKRIAKETRIHALSNLIKEKNSLKLSWDKALEERYLDLQYRIKTINDLERLQDLISSKKKDFETLLQEL